MYTPIENPKDFKRLPIDKEYELSEEDRELYWKDYETYRRFRVIKAMDLLIREINNEEVAFDTWLMLGVPDGTTDEYLWDYVKEDSTYEEWTSLFRELCHETDRDGKEFTEYDYWPCFRTVIGEDEE